MGVLSLSWLYPHLGVLTPFDPQDKLVTSPFPLFYNNLNSPFVLAFVRLSLAVYTLFTALFVLIWEATIAHDAQSYLSYFTDLSYIGLCAYFWASGVQTLAYALGRGKGYPLKRWPRPLQFLHVLLFSTITTFPIVVTIVYWSLLADSSTFASKYSGWSNISQHALNTVFALFEILCTSAGPAPWLHLPFLAILAACYLGVAYITYATQGFYTYTFLDPSAEHAKLAGYIIGIAVGICLVFSLARGASMLRNCLVARFLASDAPHSVAIDDDWQDIERPSTPVREKENLKASGESEGSGSGVGMAV